MQEQLTAVVHGDRRVFDVIDVSAESGSVGLGFDLTEVQAVRDELSRTLKSHAETLDQLSTAVAIFDPEMKLQFFNQAFVKLWGLDVAWLETRPSNTLIFDRLRAEGKLPEQPEWRKWKDSLLSAYRAVEPEEHMWHLPDTRTMRVVANPHPQGGVTWFFENMTEKFELEGRYNTLIKVQGETLDHLAEAVAVFGSDGRLRLSNPSFAALWSLPSEMVREGTHISIIAKLCNQRGGDGLWEDFVSTVTGFLDQRDGRMGQVELSDGAILSFAVVPLPKGQTMLTFIDVTDTVRVERALKEKNEALELADQIKNDFCPARLLRASLAADQYHRLHRAFADTGLRLAQRAPANISTISAPRRPCFSPSSMIFSTLRPSMRASWSWRLATYRWSKRFQPRPRA